MVVGGVDPSPVHDGGGWGGSLTCTRWWWMGWIPHLYTMVVDGVDPSPVHDGGGWCGSLTCTRWWWMGWIPHLYTMVVDWVDPSPVHDGGGWGGSLTCMRWWAPHVRYMLCCCESSCQYMYVCVCMYIHTYVCMSPELSSQWRLALYKHKDLHYACPVPLLSPLPLCSLAHIHTRTHH